MHCLLFCVPLWTSLENVDWKGFNGEEGSTKQHLHRVLANCYMICLNIVIAVSKKEKIVFTSWEYVILETTKRLWVSSKVVAEPHVNWHYCSASRVVHLHAWYTRVTRQSYTLNSRQGYIKPSYVSAGRLDSDRDEGFRRGKFPASKRSSATFLPTRCMLGRDAIHVSCDRCRE